MVYIEKLRSSAARWGIELDSAAAERFTLYARLLGEGNEKMNLVADATPEVLTERHFLDSLAVLAALHRHGVKNDAAIIDIGSGAGFPGLPLAIAQPSLEITLLDSLAKRCDFLRRTAEELGLKGVNVLNARAEESARTRLRETFDAAASRAVAKMSMLCELCLPYVKTGGIFLAMKSRRAADELAEAAGAVSKLGGRFAEGFDYQLEAPDGPADMTVAVVEKTAATTQTYPRAFGAIKKRPL